MIEYLNAFDISLTVDEIFSGMGYGKNPNHSLIPLIEEVIDDIAGHSKIKAGYRIINNPVYIDERILKSSEFEFHPGKIINSQLAGANQIALFAASLGKNFDAWSKACFNDNDPLKGYIVDTAGSLLVEKAADALEEKLRIFMLNHSLGCTNRFSPGYCGWNVNQQHLLFALLPENFCGIKLNDSALMTPIKSVSGIIGIGKGLRKKQYQCALCDMKNCILRRN